MKKRLFIVLAFLYLLFFSCEESSYEFTAVGCDEVGLVANTSIKTVKDLYVFGRPVLIEEDLIIEGYVVSNDQAGNFYKSISIQDKPENPTSAISISIDASNLYTKYEPGRKIYVKLKGLAIGNYFGRLQIAQLNSGEMKGISSFTYQDYLAKSCELADLIPLELEIQNLNESHLDMLISLKEVQFAENQVGLSYADPNSGRSIDRKLIGFNSSCEKTGQVNIRTSGFADFKNYDLPQGKGTIQGVLQNYYSDLQLVLRNEEDVILENERCIEKLWEPTISLQELKDYYKGELYEIGIEEEVVFGGYVISSDKEGSFQNRIVIQDDFENPTAGIQVLIDKEGYFENYTLGEYILIRANSLYLDEVDGIRTLGTHKNGKVGVVLEEDMDEFLYGTNKVYDLQPVQLDISRVNDKSRYGTLVHISEVQLDSLELGKAFAYYSGNNHGLRTLIKCDSYETLNLFTSGKASFANLMFPIGNGGVVGVLGTVLELRTSKDVHFNQPYEKCVPLIPPILISEVADPVNSVGSRFVELFNSGDKAFSLNNWKLEKYINGSTTVSSGAVDLSGVVMEPKSYVIIGNLDFEAVFGMKPTVLSSYISGNGDDVYRLVDSRGKIIDIFGVIGQDGNGTNWEYADGGAIRKNTVQKPAKTFNSEQWIISSKSNNFLINYPNTPKYAPIDYFIFSE